MHKVLVISVLAIAMTLPLGAVAQDEDESESYIYATYFYCKTGSQDKAEEWVKTTTAPVYDAAVKDGTIKGWGWLGHHTGGKWRAIQYHMSDSVAGLLKAQETLAERVGDGDGGAFQESCSAHDDYIWQSQAGNVDTAKRGTAALSVYHVCNINKEERADEIVEKAFAPVYEKALAEGKIQSWGWNTHVVGGKYRRLATMTAQSFEQVLAARGEILEQIYGDGDNPMAMEFNEICTSHSDYLWQVVHEAR